MLRKEVQVQILDGMEASPIALLVQTANEYSSSLYLEYGSKKVNAKSIMGMMSVGAGFRDKVIIEADGDDEEAALQAMEQFLSKK